MLKKNKTIRSYVMRNLYLFYTSINLPDTVINAINDFPFLDNFNIFSGFVLSICDKSILGAGRRCSGNSSGSNGSSSSYINNVKTFIMLN